MVKGKRVIVDFFSKTLCHLIIIVFLLITPGSISFAGETDRLDSVEMAYRIKVTGKNSQTGLKFSAVRVGDSETYKLELPDPKTIKMESGYSYVLAYIGLDASTFSKVEAGVSLTGFQANDETKRGWYPFFNFTPKKQFSPFNDPDSWKSETPIEGNSVSLELRVGELEVIEGSYRWNVHFYVNGQEVAQRPLYGATGNLSPNQFDPKLVVGCSMNTGNENEIQFKPFEIRNFLAGWLDDQNRQVYLPLEKGLLAEGIKNETVINNSKYRDFNVEKPEKSYLYSISLPPVDPARVRLLKLATLAKAYGMTKDNPNWDESLDLTGDGIIDLSDLIKVVLETT